MRWIDYAQWIGAPQSFQEVCPVFCKTFSLRGHVREAFLQVSAKGIYEVFINSVPVSKDLFAPGWTNYHSRIQFQEYDVTAFLTGSSFHLALHAGKGWYGGRLTHHIYQDRCPSVIAALFVRYADGTDEVFVTDGSWKVAEGPVKFSDIYDGEVYDARINFSKWFSAEVLPAGTEILVPQEGPPVREQQVLCPIALFRTPKGEAVLDFGQNLTGYVRFTVTANVGEEVRLSFAEVLDKDGNFYTENYRSAQSIIHYFCRGGEEAYQPHFSFQGFRYVRLDSWPGEPQLKNFQAVVVHSDMKRTGYFACSNPLVNSLYQNVLWGQRGNFLDIPTDCPQRDERMGWTGDAQVFCRAASLNFNILPFFRKWLHDLKSQQQPSGAIPRIIPNCLAPEDEAPAAWGDAAVICPWQLYETYGDPQVLLEQFDSMKKWVDYIRAQGTEEALWNTGEHYGDWLGLDAEEGFYTGRTDPYLIATAYFYRSASLLCKAGEALGKDMSEYRRLTEAIRSAFFHTYQRGNRLTSNTQTAYALVLDTGLAEEPAAAVFAARLAELITQNHCHLQTGFVGTPCILYALAEHGYPELAISLLLQEEYPSWLYPVKMGATTIWEHWDGLKPDGSMWSPDMNSFNHYAYGSVADFLYSKLCGIQPLEPGYAQIRIAPLFDQRFDWVEASFQTQFGEIYSGWRKDREQWVLTVHVPLGCKAEIITPYTCQTVDSGTYQIEVSMNP